MTFLKMINIVNINITLSVKTSGYMFNNIHFIALHVLCAQWFILTFPVQVAVSQLPINPTSQRTGVLLAVCGERHLMRII